MRIDVVTIFPEYLQALDISLIGKARREGLLDVRIHHLREHTHDRHRTVDDTPYGGGAGMVMKPQPWAEALAAIAGADAATHGPDASSGHDEETLHDDGPRPLLLVPSPAGEVFTQAMAQELSTREHLVFACGRYEGIDERVYEFAAEHYEVRPVSLGDYVLNGGEVAVLAMVEAIGRLVPGVVGNPESLVEESHSDGLLEYPVYTKPAVWEGREVPEVLLNGNHGKIARTRRLWQLERTAARRPDLIRALDPSSLNRHDRDALWHAGFMIEDGRIVDRPAPPEPSAPEPAAGE